MAKKCKDCDPNKYIEGLAYRGAHGHSFDGFIKYNDIGQPYDSAGNPTTSMEANVADMLDAHNPMFSPKTIQGLADRVMDIDIQGMDATQGFWFVWSLSEGLIAYGEKASNNHVTSAAITSAGYTDNNYKVANQFSFNITTDQLTSRITTSGFPSDFSDGLSIPAPISTVTNMFKSRLSKVGFFTGTIVSTLYGAKIVRAGKVEHLESSVAKKSLTVVVRDTYGDLKVHVRSAPTIHIFKGQSFTPYNFNINSSRAQIYPTTTTKNIIENLNLAWDATNKRIYAPNGYVSSAITSEIHIENLRFTIQGPDAEQGNSIDFTLGAVIGARNTAITAPTISGKTIKGTVGTAINESISGLNGKQKIVSISNLPEGISYDATNNKITGTPVHATSGSGHIAYASASNENTSTAVVQIIFIIGSYSDNNKPDAGTYPTRINLPRGSLNVIKNNKFTFNFSSNDYEVIQYKKIDVSEIQNIRKYNRPDGKIWQGSNLSIGRSVKAFNIDNSKKTVTEYTNPSDKILSSNDLIFNPGLGDEKNTAFWMQIDDPRSLTRGVSAWELTVIGTCVIEKNVGGRIDGLGNACYSPDGTLGPVSTPDSEQLDVTCTNTAMGGWSANPADNVPRVSISGGGSGINIEHQVLFSTPRDGGSLETTSAVAQSRLSKSGFLKYPNGIPYGNGTYDFRVIFIDTCAFNNGNSIAEVPCFTSWIGTYGTARAGDVFACSYTATCFAKKTKVLTPNGYKNIEELKINDEVTCFDKYLNIKTSKIKKIFNHNKEEVPIYKVKLDNGKTLRCTLEHPFLNKYGKFRPLFDFEVGDSLISYDWKELKIISIEKDGYEFTYNIKVERYNTYIVDDVFVHNMGYSSGPKIGSIQCGKGGCCQVTAKGCVPKGRVTRTENRTATSAAIPCGGGTLVSRAGDIQTKANYGFRYKNNLLESKDIGITSLTNISILDIISEGPIEGLVNYEIVPKLNGSKGRSQKGDIGWKNGVTIQRWAGDFPIFRSIYWNEIPLADNTYPGNGSRNFDFIKLTYDNGDHAPLHLRASQHNNIQIKEETFSKAVHNGIYVDSIKFVDRDSRSTFIERGRLPKRLTSTKTVSMKLFGKRKFNDGSERTYKKSITVLTKDLYGLRLNIKIVSLFKQIVDLTIWESAEEAEKNQTSGRIDRQAMTFYLTIKRICKGSSGAGKVVKTLLTKYIVISGKLNQGPYIETFEWTGLNDKNIFGTADIDNTIGYEIEVEPTYTESVDPNIVLRSSIDSVTELYDDFIAPVHTAGILTTFDARYFSSIPQRAYDVRLLKVKVPSNYNPFTRTYVGAWDGTFVLSWTDNPAWCFYDLLTNKRYGLGKYVDPRLADKWTLYEISKYCDQLVSDGRGGLEPRFTCNTLISTREDAYKVINDMASIFRAMVYYSAGLIMVSQDKPKEPIYLFNNSNVKDGEFTYNNTSKRVRRNVALVRYNDKDNFFKPAVKYVENRDGILKFGIRETEVSAFGCTSEGQAERLGKWTILSENLEAEITSFETSLPAMYLKPGDIILVQDQNRQNRLLGGRTYDLRKNYAILDVKFEDLEKFLPAIQGCTLNLLTPAGNIEINTSAHSELTGVLASGNFLTQDQTFILNTNLTETAPVTGLSPQVIRRKQIQSINFNSNNVSTSLFKEYVTGITDTGNSYYGYTLINFPPGANLDDIQHTLLKNTVWTLELDPDKYNTNLSPSITGFSNRNPYPGSKLEAYIDKTQRFRVLDIEEQEEFRYKITALQYEEQKFAEGDDI